MLQIKYVGTAKASFFLYAFKSVLVFFCEIAMSMTRMFLSFFLHHFHFILYCMMLSDSNMIEIFQFFKSIHV